jgi:hypothetical protein
MTPNHLEALKGRNTFQLETNNAVIDISKLRTNIIPPFQGFQKFVYSQPGAALLRRLPLAIIFRAVGAEFSNWIVSIASKHSRMDNLEAHVA